MKTLEQIAYSIGLLVEEKGTIYAECIENDRVAIYWEDATPDSMAAIYIERKGASVGRYYTEINLPLLELRLKDEGINFK